MPEEPKLDGRHHSDMEIQNGENSSVQISKMATMALWHRNDSHHLNFSNDISVLTIHVHQIEPTHGGKH